MDEQTSRWTDVELLPEWDEEFYDVYTAKKFGKWVMIKTLKPEFRDMPEYRAMIEKEFDTRYNLAHPNIVMINDFEEIPGLGRPTTSMATACGSSSTRAALPWPI